MMDNQSRLCLREASTNGTNFVALQAPASVSTDLTFQLPSTDGTSGQMLVTNGSGVLGWATSSSSFSNYRAHAYVGSSLTLSILTGSTVAIPFNTEVADPNNNFNTSTYTYTAPQTGMYYFSVNCSCTSIGILTRRIRVVKNGSNQAGASIANSLTGTAIATSLSGVLALITGDTININLEGNIGDTILANDTSFFIQMILA